MRKALIFSAMVCLIVGFSACKGSGEKASEVVEAAVGKYADVIPVLEKYIKANEDYASAFDSVKSADDVVAAMNKLTEEMKTLAPKMKEIGEKYPEFQNQENPPAELKPLMDRLTGIMGKMMGAMSKVAEYGQDPKVQEAQKAYQDVMSTMK